MFNFTIWMKSTTKLSDNTIKKYYSGVNTVSNEMRECGVISKGIWDMNLVELDIAINRIGSNEKFQVKDSTGNRMYSNALKQYRYYLSSLVTDQLSEEDGLVEDVLMSKISETEKESIVQSRVGQGEFRKALLKKYDSRCVVTGIDRDNLLIASHIKPWRTSDNGERLDCENGLLLCPNMDRLFDSGLITFANNGKMSISSYVGKENQVRLNISKGMTVDLRTTDRMKFYLDYHRDMIFVR